MSDTKREGIQRWALKFNHIAAMEGTIVSPERNGDYVRYSDHLRHLKLAQIAVLEEMSGNHLRWVPRVDDTCFIVREIDLHSKIAALRKELAND